MIMNDFTLKELYCLENAIQLQLHEKKMNELNYQKRVELRDKLNKMIENYIESELPKVTDYE